MTMVTEHISGAPVVDDDDDDLLGIITEKDILQRMFPDITEIISKHPQTFEQMESNYADTMDVSISDIMTKDVRRAIFKNGLS